MIRIMIKIKRGTLRLHLRGGVVMIRSNGPDDASAGELDSCGENDG
jgi:hypothetical protein